HLPEPPAGDVLDLGCGWGPIALHTALEARDAEVELRVWALDVNSRSLETTAANARRLGLETVRTVTAEDIPAEVQFAAIRSNPPIRIGKEALHELLETWLPRLAPDGRADLVVSKNLGADSLQKWIAGMLGDGFEVVRTGSSKGFGVLTIHRGRVRRDGARRVRARRDGVRVSADRAACHEDRGAGEADSSAGALMVRVDLDAQLTAGDIHPPLQG